MAKKTTNCGCIRTNKGKSPCAPKAAAPVRRTAKTDSKAHLQDPKG